MLQILYNEDKNIITKLAVYNEDSTSTHFCMNESDLPKSTEIADGIYVLANSSTES